MKLKYLLGGVTTALIFIGFSHPALAYENLLTNPGFEQVAPDNITKAFLWTDFQKGYTRVSGSNNTGAQGYLARLQNSKNSNTSGAYQRVDLQQTEVNPVFIGAFVKGNNIKIANGSYFGASLYAEIYLADGSIVYWNTVMNHGTFGWRWIGFNTGTLPNVNQPIDHIFIVPILSQSSGTAFFDNITVSEIEPAQSALTIMFDDGGITTYTQALPAMDTFGFTGSAAIVSSFVGDSGFMNKTQVSELVAKNWEIVSHSITHSDLTLMTQTEINRELQRSYTQLTNMGFKIKNFALPFGAYNSYILAQGAKTYKSIRAYELGDNPQGLFPHDVKVRSVVTSTTLNDVNFWITNAIANKRWEVLVFHDIQDSGDDIYHTSPQMFNDILQTIKDSGIAVVTYDQGIDMFGMTPTATITQMMSLEADQVESVETSEETELQPEVSPIPAASPAPVTSETPLPSTTPVTSAAPEVLETPAVNNTSSENIDISEIITGNTIITDNVKNILNKQVAELSQ